MHITQLAPEVIVRASVMKGGRSYSYTDLDPKRVAHLVIDMQNGFLEQGAALEVPEARSIVGNVNRVSELVRSTGGVNLFFRFTTSKTSDWPVYFEQFQSRTFGENEVADFQPGTHQHELFSELKIEAGDEIVDKTRFSAFTPGSSDALQQLRLRGVDTVLISGTLTDCCCASTARDAQQLGFRVIMIADANAALTEYEHNAALTGLAAWFADIRCTDEIEELLAPQPVQVSRL